MTTKNEALNLNNGKSDQKSQQYSNVNLSLNQNHKCLDVSVVHSSSKSCINTKTFDAFVVEKPEKGNLQSIWNKSSSNGSRNVYVEAEEETSKKKWKNDDKSANKKSNSTLSLHIAAYENSINDGDTVSLGENKTLNGKEKTNSSIKKRESISSTTIIQNSFEFPRQQTDDETNPAIMHFTASQQLHNPNQQPMQKPSHIELGMELNTAIEMLEAIGKPVEIDIFPLNKKSKSCGMSVSGNIITIDPDSRSIGLLQFDDENNSTNTVYIPGESIKEIHDLNDGPFGKNMNYRQKTPEIVKFIESNFVQTEKSEKLSNEEICKRRDKILKYLDDGSVEYEFLEENGARTIIVGAVKIRSPYTEDDCFSENQLALGRFRKHIRLAMLK